MFPDVERKINFTNIVSGRRLIVRFHPPQWIQDNAIDSGPAELIDITEAYLALTGAERAALRDNRDNTDDLVHVASDVWKKHGGPGYVEVEEFLAAFHAPHDE